MLSEKVIEPQNLIFSNFKINFLLPLIFKDIF